MKLPTFLRLTKQDFAADEQKLIERIASPLNPSIDVLYQVLGGRVSFKDNIYCNVTDITVTVGADGIPIGNATYPITLTSQPIGLMVIQAKSATNPVVYPTGGVFASFNFTTKQISLSHIVGLPAGIPFSLRIITLG